MNTVKLDFGEIINKLKSFYVVELVLIIIGVFLRLKLYISNPSFFWDECSLGTNIINKTYPELFLPLGECQCAPPFFMVLNKFILNLSHQYGNLYRQDLVLRVFPLFCSIVSLPLFAIFLNKTTNNKIFIWICTAILALNSCAINYSIQFKQYSCELLFSLILLLIFQCFDINKLSKKTLGACAFIFCISIWFSNSVFIIFSTGFMYLVLRCFSRNFRNEIKSNLYKISIIAIPFLLNIVIYYYCYFKGIYNSDVYTFMHNYWGNFEVSFFSYNNFLMLFHFKLQRLIKIPFIQPIYLIIFLMFNIAILFIKKQNMEFKTKFFIITPILLSIIASFLKLYPFERRLILYSLPLYIMLYFQFVYLLKPNKFFKILTILILGALSFIRLNTPVNTIYYNQFKHPVRNSIEFIKQNKIPVSEVIFSASGEINYYIYTIFPKNESLVFDIYWDGFKSSVIPQYIKYGKIGDYYIFTPFSNILREYSNNLNTFLKNDKHLKIIKTYTKDDFVYIIHLKKISNYK